MATQLNPGSLAGLSGIARRLVIEGSISEEDARRALEASTKQKIPLVSYLVQNGLAQSAQVAAAASMEFGIPLLDVRGLDLRQAPIKLVEEKLIQQHRAMPLFKRGNRLFVGIGDPTNLRALDEIKFHTNLTVEPIIVPEDLLDRAIEQALAGVETLNEQMGDEEGLDGLELETGTDDDLDDGVESSSADDTPIVKFVNKVLLDAIKRGASDIHFEPYEVNYRVRLRMDGILRAIASPPAKLNARIASRLKVMAGLDIAERRVPQDGRIKLNISKSKSIDFRVSTCPTLFGEKVVLRILDASAARMGIDKLGYEEDQKALFLNAIQKPYGMVLVTGPTGSGKTVSLYTALNILNTEGRNISTVEDPVEIRVNGINQVQQNQKRGMTFAAALRSFLRQDPDVILVGETRDLETAQISIRAALTGHLVFSTLHTNDCPSTIARLVDMGIPPFLISSALQLILAQRLGRKVCKECKEPYEADEESLVPYGHVPTGLGTMQFYKGKGCQVCNFTGMKGRIALYEVMPISQELRDAILKAAPTAELREIAQAQGMKTLRQAGLQKVIEGTTTVDEVLRVTIS